MLKINKIDCHSFWDSNLRKINNKNKRFQHFLQLGLIAFCFFHLQITSFKQIIDSGCSTQVRFLLCSSLFPLCSPNVPRPVPPCKSLCESVKRDCFHDPVFSKLWPSFLNCDALPEPEKQGLCMQAPEEFTVIKQLPTRPVPAWNVSWNVRKFSHILNVSAASCPSNFTLNSLEECVPQCGYDSMYSSKQKEVAELLILLLSSVCFIFTLLSLVTFWAETTRFGFPEKPIIFLTLCYNLLSVCYLERIIFHDPRSERLLDDKNDKICLSTSPCLASFITTSYLTLSAGTWWLIFGFCWYLTTNKKWSCEALEKKSGLFHVLAWILPIIPPISALLSSGVKTHELTGFCIAPGFTEIPTLGLLILGAFFTIMSVFSLKNLKTSWQQDKLTQVMTRILIFSALYLLPTISSIIISFYEVIDIPIPKCMPGDSCRPPEKLSAIPTLLKLSFILIGGATTGLWVWSKKTYDSCRNRITTSSLTSSITTTTTAGSPATTKSFIIKSNHHSILSSAIGGDNNKYKRNYPLYPGIHFQRAPVTENSGV